MTWLQGNWIRLSLAAGIVVCQARSGAGAERVRQEGRHRGGGGSAGEGGG